MRQTPRKLQLRRISYRADVSGHATWIGILWACLAVTSASADTTPPGERSQARADVLPTGGRRGVDVRIRNQTYDVVSGKLGPDRYAWTNLLVHRQQDLVLNVEMDGFLEKELSVEVFQIGGAKRQKMFVFKEPASQSAIREDLGIIVATTLGCCNATVAHAVHSLESGKRLFFAGGRTSPYIFKASWPNTDRARLVGIHVSGSERDDEIYEALPSAKRQRRILVSLASATKVLDQVAMLFGESDGLASVEGVEWVAGQDMKVFERQLEVWPPKPGQSVPTPAIRIWVAGGRAILVPLDGDHLGKVTVPDGVTALHLSTVD